MILPFLSSLACLLPLHPVFQSVFLLFVLSLVSPICYGFSSLNFNLFFFFLAWCLFGIPVPGGLSPIEPSGCCPHIPKTQAECPTESSASSTTASLLFFLRESNTELRLALCLSLSPPALTRRPGTTSWSLLNSHVESCVSKQSGYAICFFIQQMKYWMLILPDCINIVCIFKK